MTQVRLDHRLQMVRVQMKLKKSPQKRNSLVHTELYILDDVVCKTKRLAEKLSQMNK